MPAMRVHDEDSIRDDPHVRARGVLQHVEHPVVGCRVVVRAPWRFSNDGVGIRNPAPLLGQHNDYVLGEVLGLPRDEIERLVAKEVLR